MKELKNYYLSIQKELILGGTEKKKLMRDIRNAVESYLQENPDATVEDITAHFGTPQEISATYLEEMPSQELQKKLKIKKWAVGIVLGAVACGIVMWAIVVGAALIHEFKNADGFYEVDSPVVIEEQEDSQ